MEDTAESDASQALSQDEVERLLNQVEQQGAEAVEESSTGASVPSATRHDFRSPAFLSKTDLRALRLHHEEFIRALAARLSIYLRMDMDLQISKLQTVTYSSFVESLPYVSDLTLFKVAPLQGICILDIAPRLGLAIVDRLMGGPGRSAEEERDMSEIEHALLDQAVNVILSEWCNHWKAMSENRPQILGHEHHGRFLQTASPRAVMLVLAMEARFVDCVEQIQMVFPYDELEPMVRELRPEFNGARKPREDVAALRARWKPQLESIPVSVKAEYPGLTLSARDLSRLSLGQIIKLGRDCPEQIRVTIANKPKYVGQLGAQGSHRAVRLTRHFEA